MEIFDNSEKISGNLNSTRIEELYRSLFDKLHGFVFCRIVYKNKLAQDFECILVNKTFENQIGQKNITGKTFSEIAPVLFKNESNLIERCAYIANSGLSESFETYLDSLQLWVLISIQCQELDHFILSYTIITDRKDKEKSIDILLRRYHSILEISSDGIHIIDKSGNLIEANDSFCKMLGFTKNEIKHLNITDWNAQGGKEESIALISELIFKKSFFQTKYILKDGRTIDVEVNTIGIHLDKEDYLYASAKDITARLENEKKIIDSIILLKKLNTDLESFAFIASHDLKAPLSVVRRFLSLLQDQKNSLSNENKDLYLKFIQNSVEQMNNLITELLQYSSIGNNKDEFVRIDLEDLLNSVKFTLAESIQFNRATININHLPVIFGNKTLINELFINLLSNALKFHNNSNLLTIEVGYSDKGDMHQFFVSDNGIGIAAENLQKIFTMFKRLHTQTEFIGTGIGLALCKRIVETHEGEIWVESELGKGSVFYFTIKKIELTI